MSTLDQPTAFDRHEDEDSALSVLLDGDIDRVMAGLDRIVEAAPSYRKLFSRWEKQHWNSESFDFSQDKVEWESGIWTDLEREYMLWSLSSFFLGEERVTTELLPFAIAAPSMDARAFLATQISDEARHVVFFDRFPLIKVVADVVSPRLAIANGANARNISICI